MTSSPSTLPQPSHEGDEGQSAGRKAPFIAQQLNSTQLDV